MLKASRRCFPVAVLAAVLAVGGAAVASATDASDVLVSSASPATPFPQNKQNEPSVARDPISGTLIAGSNDEIDLAPCHAKADGSGTCPFTPGVGVSGIYFKRPSDATWVQPTYSGYSARTGTATAGPIGTLPNYYESGLVSGGDPVLAVGPAPGPRGFAWTNGARYYYSNLAGNFPGSTTLSTSNYAVAVSHTDDVDGAVAGSNAAWSAPSLASGRVNGTTFDDKNAMWADNAASSAYFGRVYVSWTDFRAAGNGHTPAEPEPILSAYSTDGGSTWSQPVQVSSAHDNNHNGGRQGSTIRTDSRGNVYLFFEGTVGTQSVQEMAVSANGGRTYSPPRPVANVTDVGVFDPFQGRFTFDGFAGARTDSFPSVDIANGAPSGAGATNRLVLGWSDAALGTGQERSLLQTSTDGGGSWSGPVPVQTPGDRPDFTAVAISPDGATAYAVYDAFHAVYTDTSQPRPMEGVVVALNGDLTGAVSELHRGASGDARGASTNSLVAEFLGDYNYATASNTGVTAVWNDVRGAQDCRAIDAYRSALRGSSTYNPTVSWGEDSPATASTSTAPPKPYPPTACGAGSAFGNTDIYSGTYSR